MLAVLLGVQPPPAIVLVPFIMAGNTIYVVLFSLLRRYSDYAGIIAAAPAKFILLYTAANIIIDKLPAPIKLAFSFPQLITAITGGAIALVVLRTVSRKQ